MLLTLLTSLVWKVIWLRLYHPFPRIYKWCRMIALFKESYQRLGGLIESKLTGTKIEWAHEKTRMVWRNPWWMCKTSRKQWANSKLFLHLYDWVSGSVSVRRQCLQYTLLVWHCLWHLRDQVKKIGQLNHLEYHGVSFSTVVGAQELTESAVSFKDENKEFITWMIFWPQRQEQMLLPR